MRSLKMFIYKVFTQVIVIFGRLRQAVEKKLPMVILKHRTFVCDPSASIECCDCGLTHLSWVPKNGIAQLAQPMRPRDYDYRFRKFAGKSSPTTHQKDLIEEFKDKWRVRT